MLAIFLLLVAFVHGVQKQFILPPSLRDSLYDVQFQKQPISDLTKYPQSSIISLNYDGMSVECLIPETTSHNQSRVVKPLTDEKLIQEARNAIVGFKNQQYTTTDDDVWTWYINFNSTIIQCISTATSEPGIYELLANNFQASIGYAGEVDGTNLETAMPVVVNDKHMLMVTFTNGTFCDLTTSPRMSRIYFTCDPSAVDLPLLNWVEEPYSCVYELTVGTNKLCLFPEFSEPQIPSNTILCGPDRKDYAKNKTVTRSGRKLAESESEGPYTATEQIHMHSPEAQKIAQNVAHDSSIIRNEL